MSAPTQQDIYTLRQAIEKLCLLISKRNPTKSTTREVALIGTLVPLPTEDSISVKLRNVGNSLVYTVNGGAEQTAINPEVITLFVKSTDLISVKGTGTMEYIVDHNYN
jgi:hypothetical protein